MLAATAYIQWVDGHHSSRHVGPGPRRTMRPRRHRRGRHLSRHPCRQGMTADHRTHTRACGTGHGAFLPPHTEEGHSKPLVLGRTAQGRPAGRPSHTRPRQARSASPPALTEAATGRETERAQGPALTFSFLAGRLSPLIIAARPRPQPRSVAHHDAHGVDPWDSAAANASAWPSGKKEKRERTHHGHHHRREVNQSTNLLHDHQAWAPKWGDPHRPAGGGLAVWRHKTSIEGGRQGRIPCTRSPSP